ncbi:MAG TPA: fatty acid desaturase [Kiloniellaceae bacterium]|nr:fatty acid desaturase [Kiloniellaceae bacterium]
MDHRELLQSLTSEQRKALTARSDRIGLAHLALHWGSILLLGGLIALRVPFWQLLLLPQGILVIFCFTLLHESIHRTVFKTQWLNDWVARVCGFLIVLPADWFRAFHFAHHRFTQDPKNDPELSEEKPKTIGSYLFVVSGLPVWRSHATTLLQNARGRCHQPFVTPAVRGKAIREARVMLALYALLLVLSLAAGSTFLLYVWVVPALLGQPFLRLYLMAEHGRCPFVANMLANSRTTYTNWLVRTVAWNMPYHAEHHAFPAVPFHRLPAFHELTKVHLQVTERGYSGFHRKVLADLSGTADPATP